MFYVGVKTLRKRAKLSALHETGSTVDKTTTDIVKASGRHIVPKEPGWVLAEQQEKRQPLSVWVNPDLHKGPPQVAPLASKTEGLQPPKHEPKAIPLTKPRPVSRPVYQASSKVVEKGEIERLLLDTKETCRLLSFCPRTLARLEQRGLIRSIPILRHKRFAMDDIKAFVEEQRKWKV